MRTRALSFLLLFAAIHSVLSAQIPYAKKIITPSYPELPKVVGISGKVNIEISIKGGKVMSYKALDGPPQLAQSRALEHIRSWVFSSNCPETILVCFEFVLLPFDGSKFFPGTEPSVIELSEPGTIRILAKRNPPVETNRQY